MQSTQVLLHLSLVEAVGPGTVGKLLHAFIAGPLQSESLDCLYNMRASDLVHYGHVDAIKAQKIVQGLASRDRLDAELVLIDKYAIDVVTLVEPNYPAFLKQIYAPPCVLYSKGVADLSAKKQLAVVGSRKGDQYGSAVLKKLVPDLVGHGWTIVSGGALGIDSMAHRATLEAQGKTVAVIGSGLLKPYPASNKELFRRIIDQGGALVSPFALMMEALPGLFPARNRVIAGLSRGSLVIQAAVPSGALITAKWAMDEGREVFAVPGSVDNPLSEGCHKLIQEGATLVGSVNDILIQLGEMPVQSKDKSQKKESDMPAIALTPREQLIALCSQPISFEALASQSGLSCATVQELLWDLMLEGKVAQSVVGLWQQVW